MTEIETRILGIHAVAIEIATELLAEGSDQATAKDWLTLIMAKAFSRYHEMSLSELQETINRLSDTLPRG
jgi:hypothetical protein